MWKQGDSVCIIGATQSGKTGFARDLLSYRQYAIMLVTKRDDYLWSGWRTVNRQRDIDPLIAPKWRLWPARWDLMTGQFVDALQQVWLEKNWCIYLDEMYYLQALGLEKPITQLLTQGATNHITVVVGMQRPSRVSRFALSEPRYIVSFRLGDGRDLETVREWTSREFARTIRGLDRYTAAILDKVTGDIETGTRRDIERLFGPRAPAEPAMR